MKKRKVNIVSRMFRLLFIWVVILMVLGNVNINVQFNGRTASKSFFQKVLEGGKKVVQVVAVAKPLF